MTGERILIVEDEGIVADEIKSRLLNLGYSVIGIAMTGQDQLKREHPDEPWMWQKDWAAGRISSAAKGKMVLNCIIAALWNLLAWSAAVIAVVKVVRSEERYGVLFIVALFPIVEIGRAHV